MHAVRQPDSMPANLQIRYSSESVARLLGDDQLLAVLDFTPHPDSHPDPRALTVRLPLQNDDAMRECWHVEGKVQTGQQDDLRWAEGGGWLFVAVEVGDQLPNARRCAESAYRKLTTFLARKPEYHVQRLWNYLDNINDGLGDEERYRTFCQGRLQGMGHYFADGFPAATAIGHPQPTGVLQVYCLATLAAGHRIENPRQISAWSYPRQYGPVSPSFARAMRLPAGDALAISGTAAIQGHASRHHGDLHAQLQETLTNIQALLRAADMGDSLGQQSPLKIYVRHQEHMAEVDAALSRQLPECPRILLQADICRSELLMEIDGWHFAKR